MEAPGIEPGSQDNGDVGLYMLVRSSNLDPCIDDRQPVQRSSRLMFHPMTNDRIIGLARIDGQETRAVFLIRGRLKLGGHANRCIETDAAGDITVIGS